MSPDRSKRLVIDELGQYDELFGAMRGKLANVSGETERAATSILTELTAVETRIQEMMAFLDQARSAEAVVDLLDQAEVREKRMAQARLLISTYRRERECDGQESERHLSDIQAMVETLNNGVCNVRELTRHTRILAFSATIEAAYAGEAGNGFAVVASEVKQLSQASDQATTEIQNGMTALDQTVKRTIEAMVGERLDAERAEIDAISSSLGEVMECLGALVDHQHHLLMKTRQESDHIAMSIRDLIGALQFQDVTRQQLGQVSTATNVLADHTRRLGDCLENNDQNVPLESIQTKIEDMFDQYVMAQQRDVHQAVVGGVKQEKVASLIELF